MDPSTGATRSRPATPRWSFWGSTGARTLAFSALVCSLAGGQTILPAHALTVIFLLDRSDSVSTGRRTQAELLVEGAQGDARNLHDALAAAGFKADTCAPSAMPTTLAALSNYDAVFLWRARHCARSQL